MLSVVRGPDNAALVDVLADRLAVPLDDPLATEEIVVHSRGMERWLSQQLSQRLGIATGGDGICGNVAFPFPIDVIRRALRTAGGPDPRHSVWSPERLVWPLLAAVDEGLGAWATPLTDRLAADPPGRFAILRGVADLIDRYNAHRPDMILQWVDKDDVDAAGDPLPHADRWQPALVRHLKERLGQPTLAEAVVAAVDGMAAPADIPPRLSLFGFTALPAAHLAVLAALGRFVDIEVYVLHPSPVLWDRWGQWRGELDDQGLPVLPLRSQLTLDAPHNRLLRSWGCDVTELQLLSDTIAQQDVRDQRAADTEEVHSDRADTLLSLVQQSIRDDRPLATTTSDSQPRPPDKSLQIHACPGRARQVQILRDEILRLLADDPTLQPRDIVVMCPEVETFAPLVKAHLAVPADDPDGRPDLRVRLADRALRQTNPMLSLTEELLDLASGRLTATRLVDLAGSDPVRRRFGFADDDLETLGRWISASGMRWGLDQADRQRDGVSETSGTIRFGLSRLLVGAALADEDHRTVGGITPLDDVEGNDVALAGRLAELVDRLDLILTAFRQPKPLAGWVDALTRAADLLMAEPAQDPWQRIGLSRLLADLQNAEAAATTGDDDAGHTPPLGVAEIRDALGERLQGQPSWANHRTGDVTVCSLVPMRSVPHRVVCLLGMDDGNFPRRSHPARDDLIARHPRVGDSGARSEDRQLLLDALMAASDALVVTYNGIDERSGQPRPPCVPIAELQRAVAPLVTGGSAALVRSHPLQPYDPRVFQGDRRGFDPQHEAAAVVALRPRRPRPPVTPVDGFTPPAKLDVDRLAAFTRDPVAYFYRHTVGAYIPEDPEEPADQVAVDVDGLAKWALGEQLLAEAPRLDDRLIDRIVVAGRGRGDLPPPPWGEKKIGEVRDSTADITGLLAGAQLPLGAGATVDVDAVIGERRLVGRVRRVHGDQQVTVTYSRIRAKHVLEAWITLLALTATDPERPWEVYLAGRHETEKQNRRYRAHAVHFPPLGESAEARRSRVEALLADVLDLHDDALREPLVAPAQTAAAYAIERLLRHKTHEEADDVAAIRWDHDDYGYDKDADTPAHLLLFGDSVSYDVLRAQPPRTTDIRDGPDPEPHRLGGIAIRLWAPILAHCKAVQYD